MVNRIPFPLVRIIFQDRMVEYDVQGMSLGDLKLELSTNKRNLRLAKMLCLPTDMILKSMLFLVFDQRVGDAYKLKDGDVVQIYARGPLFVNDPF